MKYELLAKEKNVHLELKLHQKLRPVFADIALTERVLQNLLDNALKFTPEYGFIYIELQNKEDAIEVIISDTGIGISNEDQLYIFERHKQITTSENTKSGMGLGLAIVKKILEIHQVNINVKSTIGTGTSFWFELPTLAKE